MRFYVIPRQLSFRIPRAEYREGQGLFSTTSHTAELLRNPRPPHATSTTRQESHDGLHPVSHMFGSELWWKGDHVPGTIGQAGGLQLLVIQEARATTDYYRTTNLGALSMESVLRAAKTQLENR